MESATMDMVFKWRGWALEAAVMARRGLRQAGEAETLDLARNGWGWLAQLGWLIPRARFELVGRYSTVRPFASTRTPSAIEPLNEVHAGVNYHLGGHDLKIQLDVGHHWQPRARASEPVAPPTQNLRLQVQMAL